MHALLLAAALLTQEVDAAPAETTEPPAEPVSQIALDLLGRAPASLDDWTPQGRNGAAALQAFAMAGREDLIARFEPGAFTYQPCPVLDGDAFEAVLSAARDAQIVIVNEAHDQPFHRDVTGRLALALAGEFDIFAAETFNYVRLIGERRSGPLGWYDIEPVFARQVRALEQAGYRLAAYDIRAAQRDPQAVSRAERVAVREEAQADNLIADVLAQDPEARIVVHVGYSHVLEAPQPQGEGAEPLVRFAARLKEKTGIDPVTVSQTHCSPAPAVTEENPAAELDSADVAAGAVLLVGGSGAAPDGAVDFFLAHPPMTFTDRRPDWRRARGDIAVAVPDTLLPDDAPVMVEARTGLQSLADPPVDRVLIYPGEAPVLLLPEGAWSVTAWRADGAAGEPVSVTTP